VGLLKSPEWMWTLMGLLKSPEWMWTLMGPTLGG